MSVEALTTPSDASLHGRLDALLRNEFRVDVLVPAADDPILGTPACEVSDCLHSSRDGGLCWLICGDGTSTTVPTGGRG